MSHRFQTEQWIPFPIEPLFNFFANPQNLPRLSQPAQKLRIEEAAFHAPPPSATPPRAMLAGPGSRVIISFRPIPHLFVRLPWELEIVDFVWNDHFTDKQIRGPFAAWQHTHSFTSETRDQPGTLLRDEIVYELPGGAVGNLAQPFMQRNLEAMFRYRHQQLEALLKRHLK